MYTCVRASRNVIFSFRVSVRFSLSSPSLPPSSPDETTIVRGHPAPAGVDGGDAGVQHQGGQAQQGDGGRGRAQGLRRDGGQRAAPRRGEEIASVRCWWGAALHGSACYNRDWGFSCVLGQRKDWWLWWCSRVELVLAFGLSFVFGLAFLRRRRTVSFELNLCPWCGWRAWRGDVFFGVSCDTRCAIISSVAFA